MAGSIYLYDKKSLGGLNLWLKSGVSYAVLGLHPKLVLDFEGEYYKTASGTGSFSDALTYSGASNKTMVDSDGLLKWAPHNLLTYSEQFDNAAWSKSGATVTADTTAAPNGVVIADTLTASSTSASIARSFTLPAVSHTIAVWAKAGTASWFRIGQNSSAVNAAYFNLSTGSVGTIVGAGNSATVTAAGDGWFKCTFVCVSPVTASTNVFFGQTDADGDVAVTVGKTVYLWGAHVYRSDLGGMVNNPDRGDSYVPTTSSAVYLPRRGHHVYNGDTWVNKGLLHESEARTNLVTYSEVNDANSGWTVLGSTTLSSLSSDPSGGTDARLLKPLLNPSASWIYSPAINTGAITSISVFAKYSGKQWMSQSNSSGTVIYASFDLLNGVLGVVYSGYTATMEDYGDGWYRCTVTTPTGFNNRAIFAVSDADGGIGAAENGDDGILLYGAQLETGSTPSSYIPTSGAQVTRAAETLTVPAANLPWNPLSVSIQMQGEMTYADTNVVQEAVFVEWIADSSNFIRCRLRTDSTRTGEVTFLQNSLAALDSVSSATTAYSPSINVPFNIASRHGSTFINGAVDGTALNADLTPVALPDLSATDLQLGYDYMGTISLFRIWADDLGDAGIAEASA